MPARLVLLDTNGWLALLNSADALHSTASTVWSGLLEDGSSVILTDWIVAETGNGLARTSGRAQFVEAVELIRSSPRARLIPVSDGLFQRSLRLYASRQDKSWGLVDCASFLVMNDEGIHEAFTTDHHFEQAGHLYFLPVS